MNSLTPFEAWQERRRGGDGEQMFAERKDESQKDTAIVKSGFAIVLHSLVLGTEGFSKRPI